MRPTVTQLRAKARRLMSQRAIVPEGKVGEYEVVHTPKKAGDELMIASMRDTLFRGVPACSLKLTRPTIVQELKGPSGTWMTDLPCELIQMHDDLAKYAKGKVLIGGLGLGIVARMCALKPSVKSFTVVELQPEVIKLVGGPIGSIVQGDLLEYCKVHLPLLASQGFRYDTALFDTWQGTGEFTWTGEVVPLRRAAGRFIKSIICWQELTMVNQVWPMLFRTMALPIEHVTPPHYNAFTRAARKVVSVPVIDFDNMEHSAAFHALSEAEHSLQENAILRHWARGFLMEVGTSWWESQFGEFWDEAVERQRKEREKEDEVSVV